MMNDEWERGSGRRGKGLHAKGAEDAEGKGRPPIEEDGGRCFCRAVTRRSKGGVEGSTMVGGSGFYVGDDNECVLES
jgi:hypothetical protein